jgi:hypothetical protein
MTGGLILGRSPNLVVGVIIAVVGLLELIFPTAITQPIGAGIIVLGGAIVALIANTTSIQVAAGDAAKARQS